MRSSRLLALRPALGLAAVLASAALPGAPAATAATAAPARVAPASAPAQAGWSKYLVTEYFPVPERWFRGAPVRAAGLRTTHRQDFLWSATGASIEFDGVTLAGERIHLADDEGVPWVNAEGNETKSLPNGGWSNGAPAWREAGWRNARGESTFPLVSGGWSNGDGTRFIRSRLRFAYGPSEPFLRYWRTAAVDPKVIPLGSRIYIPRFRNAPNRGWFVAQDTGSTVKGNHIDLYLPPPARPDPALQIAGTFRAFIVPPGTTPPAGLGAP